MVNKRLNNFKSLDDDSSMKPIKQADSNGIKTHIINEDPLSQTKPKEQQEQPAVLSSDYPPVSECGFRVKALWAFEAVYEVDISFDRGDIICVTEKFDAGWWYGTVITGRFTELSGLFPANYVACAAPNDVTSNQDCETRVKALWAYKAAENKQKISFDKGDIIRVIEKFCEARWYGEVVTGKYKGSRGYFDAGYVTYAPPRDVTRVPVCGMKVKALCTSESANERKISFGLGDIINILKKFDENCWCGKVIEGKFKGSRGYFPANYVAYASPRDATSVPECGIRAKALYDYEAADEEQMSFERDDIICIFEVFPGWGCGLVITGKFKGSSGFFPPNSVEYAPPHNLNPVPDCGIRAIALKDYEAAYKYDLSFGRGDIICIIEKYDEEWSCGLIMTGKSKGLRGFIPHVCVAYLSPADMNEDPLPQVSEQQQQQPAVLSSNAPPRDATSVPDCEIRVQALWSFKPIYRDEISFDRGDIILVTDKVDEAWWHGTVFTGKFKGSSGLFPSILVAPFGPAKL